MSALATLKARQALADLSGKVAVSVKLRGWGALSGGASQHVQCAPSLLVKPVHAPSLVEPAVYAPPLGILSASPESECHACGLLFPKGQSEDSNEYWHVATYEALSIPFP